MRASKIIAVIEFLIILALVAGAAYALTTGRIQISEKKEEIVNKKEEKIPDTDLYVQGNEYFVFVENGTAYYKHSQKYSEFGADLDLKNIIKLDSNVKRVKIFNLGTDISDTVFLILEDGTVKTVSRNYDLKKFELLENYEVDDIISAKGEYIPGSKVIYKILLKDGTTKEIVDKVNEIEE